ncbi:hypothetical protein [Streptomyces yangpuensis]|uniref:hypothetical protein n=1 Tax=Streptomyces yangpuensis TaxID=1648182 RepID=UPI0006293C2C|nr:hypothetical protein [Streptomyces yangpuensis]
MSPIEIRVHGVGEHGPLSALGSVGLEPSTPPVKGIDWYKKPQIPAHDLALINWSRTSRGVAGFLWYLAIPFTLLNVVGYTRPAGRRPAGYHAVACSTGLLATAVLTAWLIVITETVLEYVPGLADATVVAELLSTMLPAAAVAAAILCRTLTRPEHGIPKTLAWLHALLALALGLAVWLFRPARREWRCWPNSFGYGADVPAAILGTGTEPRVDAMMVFVLISTLVALLLAAALWNSAAAVITMLVFLLLHATGAILRLGAGWLMSYLDHIGAVADRDSGMAPTAHLLRVADPAENRVLLLDLVPVVACAAILGFVAALAITARTSKWRETRQKAHRPAYRRHWFRHLVVTSLPQMMLPALVVTVAIYVVLAIPIAVVASNTSWSGWPLTAALILTHAIVAAVLVFIALRGEIWSVPMAFGTVADVAGFWPVRYHPLAGSSYREEVVGGLRDVLARHRERTVVLFAHSQGSVLGAWLLANELVPENLQDDALAVMEGPSLLPPKKSLYLLTCGSPLNSLYRGFFPSYFHDRFFLRVSKRTAGWFNAWRETDPIATKMPDAVSGRVHEERIEDSDDDRLRGHSDYWIEEAPTEWIQGQLTPTNGATPS